MVPLWTTTLFQIDPGFIFFRHHKKDRSVDIFSLFLQIKVPLRVINFLALIQLIT